ncbi:MAG: sulfotransferase [Gammaproteobacteria bacterium]
MRPRPGMGHSTTKMQAQMARRYLQTGRMQEAERLLEAALSVDPADADAAALLAQVYTGRGQARRALEVLETATDRAPGSAELQRSLAATLAGIGRFEAAADTYRRVLALRPDWSDIYLRIALITPFTTYSSDVRAMEAAFEEAGTDSRARRSLAFALGKAFDDLGDYDRAFEFFSEGNRIARLGNRRSFDVEVREYETVMRAFDADYVRRLAGAGCTDASPVFVTGLPRSGTTLVEQILGAHPDVRAGGESLHLVNVVAELCDSVGGGFPSAIGRLRPDRIRYAGAEYVRRIRNSGADEMLVTNKAVGSAIFFGLIRVMLPEAKLIVCNRDPRDQALSFFQKDFGESLSHYYDLGELGRRHLVYRDLISHWQRLFPDAMLQVQYEDVVAAPEAQTRRMLEYCGLGVDPACLAFHGAAGPVTTLSLAQVRRPVNRESVGRWKNYANNLRPLLSALEPVPRE